MDLSLAYVYRLVVYFCASLFIRMFFFFVFSYQFKNSKRVNLQELGPRFTLKLKWLQKGTFDRKGEHEWMFKPEMETSRRKFFL